MFLSHLLTLKSIPLFVVTFVVFYDVSEPSIDFEVYSAISNDFSDVSIDFEDYSTISNLWCFWSIYRHWSLFRCFYWLLYTFIVYLLTLKSILMFLLTFVHFSKCIYSLWSQFQWSFYLTFVGFHSISPKGLSLGQEDSVLMVMPTFLSQWYVKPQNMTTMCNSINPNPNPGQKHQYAFKTQWMRDWREREQGLKGAQWETRKFIIINIRIDHKDNR